MGYVQYNGEFEPEFIEPKTEGADGIVNVLIVLDEGKQFSINRIQFIGVDHDEDQNLRNDFPLKTDEVFVQSKFESGIDAINKTDKFFPINKDADVEILTDEKNGSLDVVIKLRLVKK